MPLSIKRARVVSCCMGPAAASDEMLVNRVSYGQRSQIIGIQVEIRR